MPAAQRTCRESFHTYEILSSMTNRTSMKRVDELDGVDLVESDWIRERPDIDVHSIGVITRIWRVGRHLERQRNQVLAEWDADRGTIDILGMLRRAGAPYRRSAGDLTRHSLITSGGVSQRLEKLERAGLVTRHVDTADRRRVEVELTAEGRDVIDAVFKASMEHDTELLRSVLSEDEQATMTRLLRKMLLSLEPLGESGEGPSLSSE